MYHRLLASVIKEIIMFWRDPMSRSMLLLLPVIQVFVFSSAATFDVENVKLAIYNEDNGRWSQELINRIAAGSFVEHTRLVFSVAEMTSLLEQREVLLGLHFPADFSRAVIDGRSADVQIFIDGRRANAGQVTASYLNLIGAELGLDLARSSPSYQPAASAEVRHWFNPNLKYKWFIVPSLGAVSSLMVVMMMSALSIARERELGTFDQLLVSPLTPREIIISKTIPGLLGSGIVGAIVVLIAIWVFGVPFHGSFVVLFATMFPFALSLAGVGLLVSSLVNTQQQAVLGLFFALIPFMLISGFMTPVENMPIWLQYLAELSPLKHYLIIIQGSFLKSMPLEDVWHNVKPLLIIACVTFPVATSIVRRRLRA